MNIDGDGMSRHDERLTILRQLQGQWHTDNDALASAPLIAGQ
jgi:hypothetical protein